MTEVPEFYETLCLVDSFRRIAARIYPEYFGQLSGVKGFDAVTQFSNRGVPFPILTSSITLQLEDCSLVWEIEHYLRPFLFKLSSNVKSSVPNTPHYVEILLAEAKFIDIKEWSIASERINEETSEHFRQALKDNELEQLAISIRATFPFKE